MKNRLILLLLAVLFLLGSVASLAVADPVQVWVDDDYSEGSCDEHTWSYDAFITIQEGIDAVEEGGMVNVAAGTYEEAFTINKANLIIQAGSGAIIRPTTPVSHLASGKEAAICVIANGVTVDGFEIDGTTVCNNGIFGWNTSNISIKNNIIHDFVKAWDGCGVLLMSYGNDGTVFGNSIENNIIYNTGRMGIMIMDNSGGEDKYTVTSDNNIVGNTLYNTWEEAWGDNGGGIQINVGENCLISDNEVYNTQNNQRGIYLAGSSSGNTITNNIVRDNHIGIAVWVAGDATWISWGSSTPTSPEIQFNKAYANTSNGLISYDSALYSLDATKNWWGDESGPYHETTNPDGTGDEVTDNVNYDPWYADEGMTQLVSNKPVYNSTKETFHNTIQDAINNADNADIIELSTGTYNYQSEGEPAPAGLIKITKPLTIKAADGALPVIDGSGFDGVFKIHPSALIPGGQVVIEGLDITGDSVTDIAITMQGCFDGAPAEVVIRDNLIHGMNGGIDFWGAGAHLPSGWTSAVAGVEITENQFYDLGQGSNGFGVMLEDLANWATAGNNYAAVVDGNEFNNISDSGTDSGIGVAIPRADDAHEAANLYITNNDFSNVSVDVAITDGDVSDTRIVNNKFGSGGTGIHAENISNGPVDATENWWGDASGPYHETTNPDGTGDEVSDNVLYYHWYADDGLTTLYSVNAITLTKTGPTRAKEDDEITYQINYKNEGNFAETNIVITETYPIGVEFISSDPAPDTGTTNQWTVGTLEAGDEDTIEVTVKIK